MVTSDQLSIIMQGVVSKPAIDKCISLLRDVFPGCELILSTWDGSDVAGLSVDRLVLSPDPGAVYCDEVTGTLNNVNRQLVSTKAGLAAATRPYILKTRTDILFESSDFLDYFGKYDGVQSHYFNNRLLICNYYTRNPQVFDTCFHPSDWVLFGRAEDVRLYYEHTPLMTEQEGDWFRTHEKASVFFTNYLCRFTPEQHIFLGFLRQNEAVDCNCYYDHRVSQIQQTERAFAECFVVLDYRKHLQISFLKYDPNRYREKHSLLSHRQWRGLYRHYCEKRPSFLWFEYLAYGFLWHSVTKGRTALIRILARLGLKEYIKKLLQTGHFSSN